MSNFDAGILDALKNQTAGLTATAIAHKMGFSKSAKIKDSLAQLVESKTIEVDNTGRYEIYKLATAIQKQEVKKEKVTLVNTEKVSAKLPEASDSDLRGFKVDSIKIDGKVMKRVTTPDGKKIRVENDEKLLVVNNEPKYIVKTAEDVIICLQKYAKQNNMTVFTVDDIKQNRKISNDKDIQIKDDHILFMTLKKHNKAA